MSSTAGNGLTVDLSALRKLKHNLDNITSQKWGARHIGEPLDHKCGGGLEPLGPIGVYAYECAFSGTVLFVSISQVIGCEDRLRNDLDCVGWGVKLYSDSNSLC